jgi:hypothetical protein
VFDCSKGKTMCHKNATNAVGEGQRGKARQLARGARDPRIMRKIRLDLNRIFSCNQCCYHNRRKLLVISRIAS